MDNYLIVVPVGHTGIDEGSAVVTPEPFAPIGDDRVLVHFESNRFGADNMHRFVEKCLHAAGRASVRYPTIARMALPLSELKVVGKFCLSERRITEVSDPEALANWAGPIGDLSC